MLMMGLPEKEDALKGSTRGRLDNHYITQADTWDRLLRNREKVQSQDSQVGVQLVI
jgi:hypothetical protein